MDTAVTAGRIVVGTDTSEAARVAVDWAAARAADLQLPLLIVVAVAPSPDQSRATMPGETPGSGPFMARVKQAAEQAASDVAARVQERYPRLTIETSVTVEVPSYPLARATADAELVVVGARGYSAPLKTAALGGTSDAVATHARGPVAVIPEVAAGFVADPDAPVVVGVDDTAESLSAIKFAAAEAGRRGVPLVALHAWRAWPWLTESLVGWSVSDADLGAGLDQMVRDLVAPYVDERQVVETKVVVGHPAVQLVEASKTAAMVVIGSRGRGGFAGLLLGSTSREVMRQAHCPVVVTRV